MRCLLFDIPVLVWTEMIYALVRGINSTVINSTEFGCCFFETRYTAALFSFPIISKVKHLQTPDSRFLMIYSHSCFIPSELWAFLTSESNTRRLVCFSTCPNPPLAAFPNPLKPRSSVIRWNRPFIFLEAGQRDGFAARGILRCHEGRRNPQPANRVSKSDSSDSLPRL